MSALMPDPNSPASRAVDGPIDLAQLTPLHAAQLRGLAIHLANRPTAHLIACITEAIRTSLLVQTEAVPTDATCRDLAAAAGRILVDLQNACRVAGPEAEIGLARATAAFGALMGAAGAAVHQVGGHA